MTIQRTPYPRWHVFWRFLLSSILLGLIMPLLTPLGLSYPSLLIVIILIILTPAAIFASALIVLFRLHKNFVGIFISMLICIVLGMISMLFFFRTRNVFFQYESRIYGCYLCSPSRIHYLTHCIATQTKAYRKRRVSINPTE